MSNIVDYMKRLRAVEIHREVDSRLREFREVGERDSGCWFSELCFCILTANSSAEMGIRIQSELGVEGFLKLSREKLSQKLRSLGYRFYRKRADYIVEAREHKNLKEKILQFRTSVEAREWLVKNVKGIGYKEASHFLRNVGYEDVAILDRHVLRFLEREGLIDRVKGTPCKREYLEIEKKLKTVCDRVGITLAEMDIYIWHAATGKILK